MSTTSFTAGWYQDPTGRFAQRYHDGSQWTQYVAGVGGQQGTDPSPVDLGGMPPMPVGMMPMARTQTQSTNGMAIASMVLGILWVYWVGSILAVIFGHIAKKQIADSGNTQSGAGMATAGLVLGYIGVGTLVLMILIGIAAASSDASYSMGVLP